MSNEHEGQDVSAKGINLNSAIIALCTAVILGVFGWGANWLGSKVVDGNDKLTRIETSLPFIQTAVNRLENQINNLVTKPELEATKQEIKNENLKFQNELLKAQSEKRISPSGY